MIDLFIAYVSAAMIFMVFVILADYEHRRLYGYGQSFLLIFIAALMWPLLASYLIWEALLKYMNK